MPEIIHFPMIITNVEEHHTRLHVEGSGEKATFQIVPDGWWITLDSKLTLPVGPTKPDFKPGDHVRLTLEKHP